MKIIEYKTFTIKTSWRNLTYLMIKTDENIIGFGETHIVGKTHTVREYLKDIKRHIIGHDVYNIEELYRKITLLDFGTPGQVAMTGLSLLEMACLDCIGKKAKLPVYKLFGGKIKNNILAYANGWYKVARDKYNFEEATKKVIRKGYKALKFDPFGNGDLEIEKKELYKSIDLIEAVFSIANKNNVDLYIEMHGRFSPHQAIQICKLIEKYNPGFIEEPCRPLDLNALKYVINHTSIPIATGERLYSASYFRDLISNRLANIIQPDLSQCGGFLEAKKISSTAETYSMMVAPHNVGGIIATTANIHLLATLRNGKVLEHFNDFTEEEIKYIGNPYPEVIDGYFKIPEGYGWGVNIDIEKLEEYERKNKNSIITDNGLNMYENPNWSLREKSD